MNKCITAQITDFEQSVLVQANDKWRPITLADGIFDLDELKKDISAADAKFAGRKYKPTALILEYLIARASKQNVPVSSFVTEKSPSATKKRVSDGTVKRPMKRFNAKKKRPLYHTEHESWEDGEDHLKATTLLVGTPLLSSRRAHSLIAPRSFAKTGTSPTHTLRIGVTNCTPVKE